MTRPTRTSPTASGCWSCCARWPAGTAAPALIVAEAILKPEAPPQARHWSRIAAAPPAAGSRGWEFDAGAWQPVDRVRAVFAEANSMATLRLWSRADAKDPWRERGSALFYRLQADGTEQWWLRSYLAKGSMVPCPGRILIPIAYS